MHVECSISALVARTAAALAELVPMTCLGASSEAKAARVLAVRFTHSRVELRVLGSRARNLRTQHSAPWVASLRRGKEVGRQLRLGLAGRPGCAGDDRAEVALKVGGPPDEVEWNSSKHSLCCCPARGRAEARGLRLERSIRHRALFDLRQQPPHASHQFPLFFFVVSATSSRVNHDGQRRKSSSDGSGCGWSGKLRKRTGPGVF